MTERVQELLIIIGSIKEHTVNTNTDITCVFMEYKMKRNHFEMLQYLELYSTLYTV